MKINFLKIFICALLILIINSAITVFADVEVVADGTNVFVGGNCGYSDTSVVIQVLNPGTAINKIDELKLSDMCYINQTKSDSVGDYKIKVPIKVGLTYPAVVSYENKYEIVTLSRPLSADDTLEVEAKCVNVGNIFTDYTDISFALYIKGNG